MFVCLVGHICTTYMCTQKDKRLLYPWNKNCRSCDLLCVILGTEVLSTSEAASFFHHSATLEIIAGVLNHCWKALWCWQDEYSLILLKERVFEQVISTDAASIIALPSFLSSHYMGFFFTASRKHSRFSVWSQSLGQYFNIFSKHISVMTLKCGISVSNYNFMNSWLNEKITEKKRKLKTMELP